MPEKGDSVSKSLNLSYTKICSDNIRSFKEGLKMKRIIFLILILFLLLSVGTSGAKAESLTDPVHTIRDAILSYFPPVKGVIKELEDGYVKVYIESEVTIMKGTRLSVFREGEPFYHPVTKELMGRTEIPVGRIEVVRKENEFYICSRIKGDIKEGDLARITSSRIKLAFFQERDSDWTLSEAFYNSLKDSNRFEILETYTRDYEPERLSEIARDLGAEVILMLSTPSKAGKRFLNVKLYWAMDAGVFAEMEETVSTEFAESLIPEGDFLTFGFVDTEPWGSYDIKAGELIAIGDVDGSGSKKLVVSDGTNLRIYSVKEEPREVWFVKGHAHERHLSIDILDLNNNGRGEIFVTTITGRENILTVDESRFRPASTGNISSFIIEYDTEEGYKRVGEGLPYFFRVVKDKLLMQGFSMTEIFSGPVYEAQWKDGEYVPYKPLNLPSGVSIYGFTFIDWRNNGDIYLLSFDTEGYLNLYKTGELIWQSRTPYGRFYFTFEMPTHSLASPVKKWSIKGRLVPIRTEKGQEVIVVKKNLLLSRVPGLGYSGSDVYSLWWDGDVMEENLIMGGMSGMVTDYLLEGKELFLIARSGLFSFFRKAFSGDFTRGSRLYYYKFTER